MFINYIYKPSFARNINQRKLIFNIKLIFLLTFLSSFLLKILETKLIFLIS